MLKIILINCNVKINNMLTAMNVRNAIKIVLNVQVLQILNVSLAILVTF